MPARIRAFAAFALSLALIAPALAQQAIPVTFTPNPAPQGANVRMSFVLPLGWCGETAVGVVTRTGNAVQVNYQLVEPAGTICIGLPPPGIPVALDLGGFPPGNYSVTATNTDNPPGSVPVVTGTFGVFAASNVPAISPRAGGLLALFALAGAAFALARRKSQRT